MTKATDGHTFSVGEQARLKKQVHTVVEKPIPGGSIVEVVREYVYGGCGIPHKFYQNVSVRVIGTTTVFSQHNTDLNLIT